MRPPEPPIAGLTAIGTSADFAVKAGRLVEVGAMGDKRRSVCVSDPWSWSTCWSSERPGVGVVSCYNHARHTGKQWAAQGSLTGVEVRSDEEALALGLLHGFLHYYGRNTCGFVQSRAARKRGHQSQDRGYNRAVGYGAERLAEKRRGV